jgi:glutamate dehydrogenase/leucine dehydrogenase
MGPLRDFRQALAKRNTEQDVQKKLNKYTSHIAFHLYQMYQETGKKDEDVDLADAARRAEVRRVAMTMIKLMDVAEK